MDSDGDPRLPARLVYHHLNEQQREFLKSKLPENYPLRDYIRDVSELEFQIGEMVRDAQYQIESQEYLEASMMLSGVADMHDIYTVLQRGKPDSARVLAKHLEEQVTDYIPPRLYDRLFRG
ncbi:hypothetical protein SMSP2_01797 [Limihaloglobus sulfuriphilus]|uniref:Uncharacterized protein n=1 Tax=Limihaloglobus sulfuriphilus TaxID=1851148 RepID=A0A1Q2MFE5_9BACT|nr:hypothetical protein [Limihaloglobus sulfuriphilus]AQQ71423.1 hypothetical protein SMSP2_01797 [Limihaloglobus sulfuriphilus]